MEITDIVLKIYDFIEWDYVTNQDGIPYTLFVKAIYEYELNDTVTIPETKVFQTTPIPIASALTITENRSSQTQLHTIKFSEKKMESVTNTTVHGFKIGGAIKVGAKGTVTANFLVSGGTAEANVELSLTGEYNYSSTTANVNQTEKTWEITENVSVASHTSLTSQLIIMQADIRVPMILNSNLIGKRYYDDYANMFFSYIFQSKTSGRTEMISPASRLANQSWPGKPIVFKSGGSNGSLNLSGFGYSDLYKGLYAFIRYTETPLDRYSSPGKTWDSNLIHLRDGQILNVYDNRGIVKPVRLVE